MESYEGMLQILDSFVHRPVSICQFKLQSREVPFFLRLEFSFLLILIVAMKRVNKHIENDRNCC